MLSQAWRILKREYLAGPLFALCLILWLGQAARADLSITANPQRDQPIVATVVLDNVPEGAVIKGDLVPDIPGAHVLPGPTPQEFHIWAAPGKYTAEVLGMWGMKHPTTEGAWSDFGLFRYKATFTVAGDPQPPPPEPDVNPHRPAPAFESAARPVQAVRISPSDSKLLAQMYATVASQTRAGAFSSLGAIRSELVKRGGSLNLRGKYPGLAPAVEQYLTTSLGLEESVPAERVGDCFETLAWAVWRSQ